MGQLRTDEKTEPATPAPAKAEETGGAWKVKQYPKRLSADFSADPIHVAILTRGKETKELRGTYDDLIIEVKKLTGATK